MTRAGSAIWTCALACATLAALAAAAGSLRAQDTASRMVSTGSLGGTIADTGGAPLGAVDVVVIGTALRTRSRADGRFLLSGIPVGGYQVIFRKLGFEPASFTLDAVPGSQHSVAVTLGPLAYRLDTVTVTTQVFNELGGIVTDSLDRPLGDADVQVVGSGLRMRTRADGRFLFLDVTPGKYLLKVRKLGYRPHQRSLEMVRRLERNITAKLSPLARELSPIVIREQSGFDGRAALAQRDFEVRRKMAGSHADFLTQEELAKLGRTRLDIAIRETAAGISAKQMGRTACVLEDGIRPAAGSYDNRGSNESPVLGSYFADQVDAVELYPAGSEMSMTACARFGATRGCDCSAFRVPPVIIVWLKH